MAGEELLHTAVVVPTVRVVEEVAPFGLEHDDIYIIKGKLYVGETMVHEVEIAGGRWKASDGRWDEIVDETITDWLRVLTKETD
jgi:hypothetical protein